MAQQNTKIPGTLIAHEKRLLKRMGLIRRELELLDEEFIQLRLRMEEISQQVLDLPVL